MKPPTAPRPLRAFDISDFNGEMYGPKVTTDPLYPALYPLHSVVIYGSTFGSKTHNPLRHIFPLLTKYITHQQP